jgi:hypothetical protein
MTTLDELEAIRARYEADPYDRSQAVADRATLLRLLDAAREELREVEILKRLAPEYFRWTGGHDQTEDPEWICDKLKYGGAHFENVCTPDVRLVVYDDQDRRAIAKPGDYIVNGDNGLRVLPALKAPATRAQAASDSVLIDGDERTTVRIFTPYDPPTRTQGESS